MPGMGRRKLTAWIAAAITVTFLTMQIVLRRLDGDILAVPILQESEPPSNQSTEGTFQLASKGYFEGQPRVFDYREVLSQSKPDRAFWPIDFGRIGIDGYNPSVIPHPTIADQWIVMAQRAVGDTPMWPLVELACSARFTDKALRCIDTPMPLPVTPSVPGNCKDDLVLFNTGDGPRDGRMFYGPVAPYIMYGSQATFACLGIWAHDLRKISDAWQHDRGFGRGDNLFQHATEIRRPAPWRPIEKNFFLFWDSQGLPYAHYDFWPKRSFARIQADGSTGRDLAPLVDAWDRTCMTRYMPALPATKAEAIHQATNAIHITMCQRFDTACKPTDENTFIMSIYHYQSYYELHGVYDPFVFLFKRSAPFGLHAISQRPFFVHGRGPFTHESYAFKFKEHRGDFPKNHTEMFYITSVNWMLPGRGQHGFIDDTVMISFGVEDSRAGTIDVVVGDLLQDLAYCDTRLGKPAEPDSPDSAVEN